MISSRRFLVTWNERLGITLHFKFHQVITISDVVLINATCYVPVLMLSEFNITNDGHFLCDMLLLLPGGRGVFICQSHHLHTVKFLVGKHVICSV